MRGWFKRAVAALLMVTLTLSSTGQAIAQASNLITGSNGRPFTGYRADGTYVQAGRTDSSYHQQVQDYHLLQHQLQNPALWTTSAVALSSSTNPDFVQMTIDQMMAAIAPTGTYAPGEAEPGGLYLGRLYLNINNPYLAGAGVLSAPPADAPESGATPPTGPLIDNYQHYALALAYAQSKAGGGASGDEPTGGWQSSVDGQYVGKSHEDSANSLKGKAFNDFIGKAAFQGAQDPLGGATAFFLIQGEQAKTHLSHLQQQQGGQLGSPILYTQQTLGLGQSPSGCGGRDSAPCPDLVQNFFNNVGSAPAPTEDERSTTLARFGLKEQDFVLGYIRGDGLAHDFEDGLGNLHFKNVGQNTEKLGEQLRQGAQQHWLGQQAAGAIDFGAFKEDRELFLQGVNPYGYVNKADHWLLNGLRNGSIQPGHPDYERARALAEQGFRSAYAAQVEYGFRPTFTKEGAAYQASKLELNTYSDSQFFEDGLYLYKNISQHDRELLDGLRHGLIKPGDALYNEARALAEARYRAAFQKALEPPKKSDPIKQLVAVVVAVVAAWVIGPMVTQWAAGFVPGATATVGAGASASSVLAGTMGTTATVGSVVATGIGSTVAGMASAAINTTIITGDLGKGLDAAGKALTSGVVSTAINALVPGLGITSEIATKAINTAAIAAGTTAAYGGSFGDNLLQAAINAGTDAVAESAANWIGSTFAEGSLGNYAAHAALGCAAGAARGGSSEGCGAGAAGAVVGNWAGQQVHQNLNSNDPNALLVAAAGLDGQSFNSVGALASNLAGGFAGALVGGSSGNTQGNFFNGGAAGQNAFENNYLKHIEREALKKAEKSCLLNGSSSACATAFALQEKDALSDRLLANATATCQGAECNDVVNFINQERAALGCPPVAACPDAAHLDQYRNVALTKAQGLEGVYPEAWLLDAKAALDLAKWGVKVVAGASGKNSLEALQALSRTSGDDVAKASNNFYRDDFQQYDKFRSPNSTQAGGEWDWSTQAPNGGAVPGTSKAIKIEPGQVLDRYGSRGGTYLSPVNTPYEQRSLAPGAKGNGYERYEVTKPFNVVRSEVAPAMGQPGGGIQYQIVQPDGLRVRVDVQYLIDKGYLSPLD
ncbi:glycohydrolase toxin TNT-related protein [Hydrogenophaga sp. NFH-34]|uniref:glycohydrolase toxin TNT-related protein n=1 Tax=Hydrogenophaga sp. NFH-34 TaxID=2744446 RepID=UPI001F3AF81D|nr:glycohydrolase toxin TNT-related protein [Hydrogenophaga sp. NFH-34]